ncbi:MAG: GvpL/GvpF family gas vesicle protein, partial [Candidatus Omnitrophota bacterium]|nr:GvpL/GvpF family gas vesicle protein [Candidatus Omnitrophota bacterium]
MSNNALYIYGIIRTNKNWKECGIKENNVFLINEGNFSAIVHSCDEKPYNSSNPDEVKDLILAHNRILDKAMENFDAVIPLSFNTIIKTSEEKTAESQEANEVSIKTSEENLRSWLKDNEENLLEIWDKILGKKEYGIRIYYEKEKLLKKIKELHEIKQLRQKSQIESVGM